MLPFVGFEKEREKLVTSSIKIGHIFSVSVRVYLRQ